MFLLSEQRLEEMGEQLSVKNERGGAWVWFEGRVRNDNAHKEVTHLQYESYEKLTVTEAQRIIDEAKQKYDILDVRSAHRVGNVPVGEISVVVGVLAGHRGSAFDACRYLIDQFKKRLAIWKKEFYADGQSAWVNAQGESRDCLAAKENIGEDSHVR